MSFVRTRTIKGKQYLYEETRWREGGKVRSRSVSLGPVHSDDAPGGWLRRQLGRSYGVDWAAIEKQMLERQEAADAKEAAFAARVYLEFGMKVGTGEPIEVAKPVTVVDLNSLVEAPAADENAPPDGDAGDADVSGTPGQ